MTAQGPRGVRRIPRSGRLVTWSILLIVAGSALLASVQIATSAPSAPGGPVVISTYCGGSFAKVSFRYVGTSGAYLTVDPGYHPQWCVVGHVSPRWEYGASLVLRNLDRNGHTILQVTVDAPFGTVSETPESPFAIGPNESATVSMRIEAPALPGDYGLPSATVTSV